MAPARGSQTSLSSQDFLTALGKVYRGSHFQRDVFGRRTALPSEIARTLAQNADDPVSPILLTGQPGHTTSHNIASQQNASEG